MGIARQTAIIAHKIVQHERAAQEDKPEIKNAWNRHLRALDKFADMATQYKPEMAKEIEEYTTKVKRIAA